MEKLFPRIYGRLLATGHQPDAAKTLLRDARRGDRCSLVKVRALASLHRVSIMEYIEMMDQEPIGGAR